jgi:ubiquitin-protein ligase
MAERPPTIAKAQELRGSILKQMFDQFVNRILAYNYATHLGLITIGTTARLSRPMTHVVEDFRATVKSLKPSGDTALWDALALARDQVLEHARKYPNAKKRILCISDGGDTKSTTHAGHSVSWLLRKDGIVLDSFCLGKQNNDELLAASYLTGGYKFHPTSLQEAMAICEMEPVLSQLERSIQVPPGWAVAPGTGQTPETMVMEFKRAIEIVYPEVVTEDEFPQRKKHQSLDGTFVELKAVSRNRLNQGEQQQASASMRIAHRILTEMQHIVANPHPHYDVYVNEENMAFWKVVMQGPPGSVYESGTFVLYLDMEEGRYPLFAPKARFVTRIHHPNVNRHGRICHSIFDRNWTMDTTNSMILSTIYGLLLAPDYSDPV